MGGDIISSESVGINPSHQYIISLHGKIQALSVKGIYVGLNICAIDINGEIFLSGNVIPIGIAGEVCNHSRSW